MAKGRTASGKSNSRSTDEKQITSNPPSQEPQGSVSANDLSVLKSVFDAIEDVIYVADPQSYELVFVNAACRSSWGEDVIGRKCYSVLQGRDAPCPFCTNHLIFGEYSGRSYIWEFQNEITNSWFRCVDRAIDWPDGRKVRFELASDISLLKNTEAELLQQQETLESQVEARTEELGKQAEELRLAGNYNRSLFDANIDPYLAVDPGGCITDANSATIEATGRDTRELIGAQLSDLFFNPTLVLKALETAMEQGTLRDFRADLLTTKGEITPSVISISPYHNENGEIQGFLVSIRDIRERLLAELALKRTSRITGAVSKVFRSALVTKTEEEFAQSTLHLAEELTGSRFGFIGDVNAHGSFDTIGLSNPGWEACAIEGSNAACLLKGMEMRGIWSTVIRTGASVIVNDPGSHPDRVGVPKGHPPLTAFLGVPLLTEGRAVGMIALANKTNGYTDTDVEAIEALATAFHQGLQRKRLEAKMQREARLKETQALLVSQLADDPSMQDLANRTLSFLCQRLQASVGLIYTADEDDCWHLRGGYAYQPCDTHPVSFASGEGFVGQVAIEQKRLVLKDLPQQYFKLQSGLGQSIPPSLVIHPVIRNAKTRAILELAFTQAPDELTLGMLDAIDECLASAIESTQAREVQARLLARSQEMTEELQAQQEELRAANEELAEQTQRLQESESRLLTQQAELQAANEELEEKSELLKRQKQDVETARAEISRKADELTVASKYKSEFLANMSHELRTPLNSLLLLARSLADNGEGNLSEEQVHSAKIIYQGGNDLLQLINDILDLTKIEAGRMDLHLENVPVAELSEHVSHVFSQMAIDKGISLVVDTLPDTPSFIHSDRRRIEQILKNLCANAIKFTLEGEVRVLFSAGVSQSLCVTVSDTGIGIPEEYHRNVFEAFRQVDGSTSRKYGGTGLGLSIVKQLLEALGGRINLKSAIGKGSTFTIHLPNMVREASTTHTQAPVQQHVERSSSPCATTQTQVDDDRDTLQEQDTCILIIEDDPVFAEILAKHCRQQGMKAIVAMNGESGVELAERYIPSGILLDIQLPGMDGWRVLELLKASTTTRHIPVHIISAIAADNTATVLTRGAIGQFSKPVSATEIQQAIDALCTVSASTVKHVLVIEDDPVSRERIVKLLSEPEVYVDAALSTADVRDKLRAQHYNCIILDLNLWQTSGCTLLKELKQEGFALPPVVVNTARDLTWEEDLDLRSHTEAIIIKGAHSDDRLLDEVSLFLHQVVSEMPRRKQQIIADLHDNDRVLRGRRVLLVDDDMRTLFALTKLLTERGMQVHKADNGESALASLDKHPDTELILMDIMMPVLDGYETMKRIREQERFRTVPIVALTAKAMREDQERCMRAGASDYMTKPVDANRLLSMLRVWLYHRTKA